MKAIITTPVTPLMLRPSHQCERADEALFGWPVDILEDSGSGWCRVETHYRYTGYVSQADLLCGAENATRWAALPKKIVLRGICDVLAAPDVQSWALVTLTRGALVSPIDTPNEKGWQKISLPDGREGYTKTGFLGEYYVNSSSKDEATLRQNIMASAMTYMGAHYRWGGKSPMGLDCSGLTAMAYLLNGVLIYRDAHIKEGFPLHTIPRERMQPADLLFFPGHVALYLGDGKFIHSTAFNGSDGVVINSLNPSDCDYREDLEKGITAVGSIF